MSVDTLDPFAQPRTVWRFSAAAIALTVTVAMISVLPFWDGVSDMWKVWLTIPEYSHGLMIPPLAAFLIWQQKDRLELQRFDGSWWGVALVALAGVLLTLGQIGAIYALIQYAFVMTVFGLVLALTGKKAFRLLIMPLLILFFMIPLPTFLLSNLSSKLQLLSSSLGVWFIRSFGISVFLEGNVIDLGVYQLQVAEACNGLRYLFPLLTLGFLIAYFYKGALWKRVVIFLSSIPLTAVMNSFRIGTIGVMVDRWGISMAEGFLHEFQGWAVFMVSAGLMIGEIAILNRFGHEKGNWRQLFGVELPSPSPRGVARTERALPRPFLAACGLLVALAIIGVVMPRPAEIKPQRATFAEFPLKLGPWTGRAQSMDGLFVEALKFDDYVLNDYTDDHGSEVTVYSSYYASQRKGEAVHSPRACMPGGGWQMSAFGQRALPGIDIAGRPLYVNRTLIQMAEQRQLVYYWFEQRGRIVTNELAVKWYLFVDALTRNRTDGALVRLTTRIPPGGSEVDADRRLVDMAARIAPLLTQYVPD